MALIKNKMTEYGVEAEYWRISRFTVDTVHKEVFFTLALYLNKTSYKELDEYTFASTILDKETFEADYNKYFRKDKGRAYKDIYTACYMYAKDNIEYFKDASDDEEESQNLA